MSRWNWKSLLAILWLLATAADSVHAHSHHDDESEIVPEDLREELLKKWDQDWAFSGISSFAHLKPVKCLVEPEERYDIAIIGAPFDTSVTYRPGARFGPRAIRAASARQLPGTSYNARAGINPYLSWATVTDCGDIPITPFDNALAARQMYEAFLELGSRPAKTAASSPSSSSGSDSEIDGNIKGISAGRPKLITLGGDHSVALPALRALYKIYNKPITVVHFDAHLDTWDPTRYTSHWLSEQSHFNHGSFFHIASREGLICNKTSVHAGLRTRLTGVDDGDYTNPGPEQGFLRIHADDIDEMNGGAAIRGGDDGGVSGPVGIANRIINRVGLDPDQPVYLSVDIDVLDPSTAPGTGTPEPGGWTTREFIRILRGIEKLNIVGADIVEVSPSYDNKGETTALAAAQVAFEIVTSLVKAGVGRDLGGWYGRMEQQKPQQQQQRHEAESERTVKSDGGKDEL